MIKKYLNFIKENNTFDTLNKAITDTFFSEQKYTYYSDLCKTNQDPEEDFKEINKLVSKRGWNLQRIKKEFNQETLLHLYNSKFSQVGGYCDLYFYKVFEKLGFNKDLISLGGESWQDYAIEEEEAIIRYQYGYHKTKYGKLSINQTEGGISDFILSAMKGLQEHIYYDLNSHILSLYTEKNLWPFPGHNNFLKIKDFSIVEDDRMIIYPKEISEHLNNKTQIMKITHKDVYNKIISFLEPFDLEIDFTGEEVIIWNDQFDENKHLR